MTTFYVVKQDKAYDEFGTMLQTSKWVVTFTSKNVVHYPNNSKVTLSEFGGGLEGVNHLEIAWLNTCECVELCNADIKEGYYAYLVNKFWKIVGLRPYDDCGCMYLKIVLQRFEPRETSKAIINCIECFEGGVNCEP